MENEKKQISDSAEMPTGTIKTWSLKPSWENNVIDPERGGGSVGEIIFAAVMFMAILVIVGSLLAVTNFYTSNRIKENEYNANQKALETIFPEADEFDDVFDELDDTTTIPGVTAIYKVYAEEELIGYCTAVNSAGFSSQGIDMIVGSDTLNRVTMIQILDSGETPGIGTDVLVEDGEFIQQFKGLARPVEFSTAVVAVSGATATSEGVRAGADTALKAVDLVRVMLDTVGESNE